MARSLALAPMLLALATPCWAQRGESFSSVATPAGATEGFTGFLDGDLAEAGSVVVNLPSLTLDYGVNENFTVGVIGLAMVAGFASGDGGFGMRARMRGWSQRWWTTTFDFAGVVTWEGNNTETLFLLSSHFIWLLSSRHRLTTSLYLGRLDSAIQNGTATLPGLGYQGELTSWLVIEASIITLLTAGVSSDTRFLSFDTPSQGEAFLDRSLLRAGVGVLAGDSWLLTVGVVRPFTQATTPWLGVTKKW